MTDMEKAPAGKLRALSNTPPQGNENLVHNQPDVTQVAEGRGTLTSGDEAIPSLITQRMPAENVTKNEEISVAIEGHIAQLNSSPQSSAEGIEAFLTWWYGDAPAVRYALNWKYPNTGNDFPGAQYTSIAAMARDAERHDRAGTEGVWFRVTTLAVVPSFGKRGGAADTQSLVGLWADLDFQSEGHKAENLPANEDEARTLVARAGLPKPSAWVHTGGGLSPFWKLTNPLDTTTDEGMERAQELAKGWISQIQTSSKGVKVDGVKDISRVMRLPGTTNRKPERVAAGTVAPVRVLSMDGPTYAVEDLEKTLEAVRKVEAPAAAVKAPTTTQTPTANPFMSASQPYGNTKRPAQAWKQWREGIARFEGMTSTGSGRGDELYNLANQLSHGIRAGVWSRGELENALHAAARRNGLEEARGWNYVDLNIARGIDRGINEPWEMLPDLPEQGSRHSKAPADKEPAAPDGPDIEATKKELAEIAEAIAPISDPLVDLGEPLDVPEMDEAREELAAIEDLAERKTRARQIARDIIRSEPDEYELGEWRELLNSVGGLLKGDFKEMVKKAAQERKRAEKTKRKEATPKPFRARPGRPELDVTNEGVALDWLQENAGRGALSGLFLRGDLVVRTPAIGEEGYIPPASEADEDGPAKVAPVDKASLAALVSSSYTCFRTRLTKDGDETQTRALFPRSVAESAIALPDQLVSVRKLKGVTHVPMIRADGGLLDTPGYDPESKTLYLPEPGLKIPPIPAKPTSKQVKEAVELIDQMIGEFNFNADHDRSNYIGFLLTPLLRHVVPPPYKMGVITAPMPGSGKSFLASFGRIIHGGVLRAELPEKDEELKKDITTILSETTAPVVTFDNLGGVVRSSSLASLITDGTWEQRRLGGNIQITVPNDRLWLFTGNNVKLGGDLPRRAVWVTIDPKVPNPHERTDFKIKDIQGWVRDNRALLLWALLTMIQGWDTAGRPARSREADTFGKWSEVVEGILTYAEIPGGFDSKASRREEIGQDDSEWEEFLESVERVFGTSPWTCRELLRKVTVNLDPLLGGIVASQGPIHLDALPTELTSKLRLGDEPLRLAKSLGRWLDNRDGRWAGTITVRSAGKDRTKTALWRVERSG